MSILKLFEGQPLRLALAEITHPVKLRLTTPDRPQPESLAALVDLARLCPLVSIRQEVDPTLAADVLAILGAEDRGLHFNGPPLGTELAALVSAVVVVGRRDARLSARTRGVLATLRRPVHLEVFTTPT